MQKYPALCGFQGLNISLLNEQRAAVRSRLVSGSTQVLHLSLCNIRIWQITSAAFPSSLHHVFWKCQNRRCRPRLHSHSCSGWSLQGHKVIRLQRCEDFSAPVHNVTVHNHVCLSTLLVSFCFQESMWFSFSTLWTSPLFARLRLWPSAIDQKSSVKSTVKLLVPLQTLTLATSPGA